MSGIHTAESAEPNLTPILDMVFQLITFFMLVINIKVADNDTSLHLPVLGAAVPIDPKKNPDVLVLNIDADGQVIVQGRVETNLGAFLAREAQAAMTDGEIATTVILRGDAALSVDHLMAVVDSCLLHGFRQFDFMVMRQ